MGFLQCKPRSPLSILAKLRQLHLRRTKERRQLFALSRTSAGNSEIVSQYSRSPISVLHPMMSRYLWIKRRRRKEGGLVLDTPLSYQTPSSFPQVPGVTALVWQRGEGTPGRLFSLTLWRVLRHFPRLPRWMVTNSRGRGLCESCTVYQPDSSWQTLWGRLKGELAAHNPAPKPAQVHCCR